MKGAPSLAKSRVNATAGPLVDWKELPVAKGKARADQADIEAKHDKNRPAQDGEQDKKVKKRKKAIQS